MSLRHTHFDQQTNHSIVIANDKIDKNIYKVVRILNCGSIYFTVSLNTEIDEIIDYLPGLLQKHHNG